jgi:transposase
MCAGELLIVVAPMPACDGLRDLVVAREEVVRARRGARRLVVQMLLRDGHVYRDGRAWSRSHRVWVSSRCLSDELAQMALEHARGYLVVLDGQIAALDRELERVAAAEPWVGPAAWLCCFRGISTRMALELLAGGKSSRRAFPAAGECPRYQDDGLREVGKRGAGANEIVFVSGRGM